MRSLVVAALWVDLPDGLSSGDATQRVSDALKPLKAEETRGAVVAFDHDHRHMAAILHDLRRFDLAEVGMEAARV